MGHSNEDSNAAAAPAAAMVHTGSKTLDTFHRNDPPFGFALDQEHFKDRQLTLWPLGHRFNKPHRAWHVPKGRGRSKTPQMMRRFQGGSKGKVVLVAIVPPRNHRAWRSQKRQADQR